MTYSAVVMWLWVVALGVTATGLVLAVRALFRVDEAMSHLAVATVAVAAVPAARATLDRATAEAAGQRAALHARAVVEP